MSFIIENGFLKGTQQLSAVDTHYEGTADLPDDARDAASSQTPEGFALSPNFNLVTYPEMNRASVNPGLFGELPVNGTAEVEPPLSQIFTPEGTAMLVQDLFFEGVRRSQDFSKTTEPDNAQKIANLGNLLFDVLKNAQRKSNLS